MELSSQILSDITIHMKYARYLDSENRRETWKELVARSEDMHIQKFPHLKQEINSAFKFVYTKKVLPSMRGLQFGGKPIEVAPNRGYNCSYCPIDDVRSFSEVMFLLLGGSGVGVSVQQHHIDSLPEILRPSTQRTRRFLIGDSIEGWSDAVKTLIYSYFRGTSKIRFDFSDIRKKGSRLVTSGGKAPGPQPLKECLIKIDGILSDKESGSKLTTLEAHDIICHIADAVLAGGIRRAAIISLFSADDYEMLGCKSGKWFEKNPQRGRANNSVVLMRHRLTEDRFFKLWSRIEESGSGEPGIYLTNDQNYGVNPCCEIALKPYSFCNLTEINVSDITTQEELNERAVAASFIGTLQAAYTDFHYLRPIWQRTTEKDALIGVSMTGIASGGVLSLDTAEAAAAVNEENARVADLIGINKAARTTCIKPSGSTSLVVGSSSGIHAWHSNYYIRRLRVGKNESIYTYLQDKYPELLEDDYFRPHDTAIICVPQKAPDGAVTRDEDVMTFLERIKKFSNNWIRPGYRSGQNLNNVSATISIKADEWAKVGQWMWDNRVEYNGLSVLPHTDHTYKQPPFEECTEEVYEDMMKSLRGVDMGDVVEVSDNTNLSGEAACAGGACEVSFL